MKTGLLALFSALIFAPALPNVEARACVLGDSACPQDLRFAPGATSVSVSAALTPSHNTHTFRFAAHAGQTVVLDEEGAMLRGQLFLQGPRVGASDSDDFTIGVPFKLPATGTYTFTFTANTMAEGAFGPLRATLAIK
jgi:hypothetical protein